MSSGDKPSLGIEGMPVLRANVHPDVAEAIKSWAASNDMSIRSMVRAILHEFAEDELGVKVDAPAVTKWTRKNT